MLEWFGNNQMMANPDKFAEPKPLKIEIEGFKLESAKSVDFLGLTN